MQYVLVYLLPQSEALQPDSDSSGRQNRCRKMHFNFGLIFTHDAWKRVRKEESQTLKPKQMEVLLTPCPSLFLPPIII